jgi:hypothetical protein
MHFQSLLLRSSLSEFALPANHIVASFHQDNAFNDDEEAERAGLLHAEQDCTFIDAPHAYAVHLRDLKNRSYLATTTLNTPGCEPVSHPPEEN